MSDREAIRRLFRRWRATGDLRARDEIFQRHRPLVRRLARRYWNPLEPFDDLYQVASMGLLAAMHRFDPDRGPTFAGFAIPTILGELKRHFRDTGWSAHVPRGAQELARRVEQASDKLVEQTRRTPSVAELAEYLELDIEEVLTGLQAAAAHYSVSLDAPAPGGSSDKEPATLADALGAEDDRFAAVATCLAFSAEARRLPTAERRALALRLESGLKQSEIAQRLGCSQMQVSRLLRSAAEKLRRSAC